MLTGILMILGGAIAAMSLIAKKSEKSGEMLAKLVPFQGYVGIALLLYGIYTLIFGVLFSISILGTWPLWWITMLVVSVVEIVLGFMLGFGLISKYALDKKGAARRLPHPSVGTIFN
jgi:hypothetical protein